MVRAEPIDDVLLVTIDRPERRNAVDAATLRALAEAQATARRTSARVVVLTGAPPAFCAGADLTGVEEGEFARLLALVLRGFTELPVVTMAAIHGAALGAGTQLAVACDLRVADPTARFGIPAAKLGLAVDPWTVRRVAQELGPAVARSMLLTAQEYTADRLHAMGGVHRLGDLDAALAWAHELSQLAPLTIAAHKIALEHAAVAAEVDELVDAARAAAWASADAVEGRQAFLEKRRPRFTGA
jgi:enoyl-CoA hydratase